MSVELLWWEGCPSHPRAREMLSEALGALGRDPEGWEAVEVTEQAEAAAQEFAGSPTFRVQGRDLFPPAEREEAGLSCRVYKLPDGRISPLPDAGELRAALSRALEEDSP